MYVDRTLAAESFAPVDSKPPSEFADVVEAIGQHLAGRDMLWVIGDLLVKHCGLPGKNGAHNASAGKMRRIGDAITAAHGEQARQEFSNKYLERLRQIASRFLPPKRLGGVGWSLHSVAGNPKTLHEAVEAAQKRKTKLTVAFVKNFIKNWHRKPNPDRITEAKDILRQGLAEYANRAEWLQELLAKSDLTITRQSLADDLPEMLSNAQRIIAALNKMARAT